MAITLRINQELGGIELLFPDDQRPDANVRTAMKEHGFRWHNQGKYWFARNTEDRLAFAQKLAGVGEKEISQPKPEAKKEAPAKKVPFKKAENTFASVYDSIGNCKIQNSADISVHSLSTGIYCKEANAFFRCSWGYGDCITVTDLTNAGKSGKTCTTWRLRPHEPNGIVSNHLTNEENLKTCAELIQALREGRQMDSVNINISEDKGIETFSPFIEVKPLSKMPAEWNKRNFTTALLSGQIYMGQVDYRYTDDYALDAANNFSEGIGINIPNFARDVVEGWSSVAYVHSAGQSDGKTTCSVSYSEHSNSSKTLLFDLNCDIREGKRRADERAAGIKAHNDMMKASCIHVSAESIQAEKIYSVTSLDMSANTGIYGTRTENMQGSALQDHLTMDWSYLDILSVSEKEIQPDQLFEIASFYHSRAYAEPDDRVIDCGNSLQLVTGLALMEMTKEGVSLPHIREASGEYRTIESARACLNQFISGDRMFMFTGLRSGGYEKALEKLNKEAERAGYREATRSSVNDLIAAAQNKAVQQNQTPNEKGKDFSR